MAQLALNFPLYELAEALGVRDGHSAFIVAPTATGRSNKAICRALACGAPARLPRPVPRPRHPCFCARSQEGTADSRSTSG